MRPHTPATSHRWQIALILALFAAAVSASAVAGWRYARGATPHQGPIVLISVAGLRPTALRAYGGTGDRTPAIDALSEDAVVFDRAYAHSPLTLPAHASLLAGQLPFEHGVRDEAGFVLRTDARPLAELLRSRGFETGAAVSSFLLRPESGVSQGFTFFDADLPDASGRDTPVVQRDGTLTSEVAEQWLRARRGHRFFLFVQVDEEAADAAVTRLVQQLKTRGLYDRATIVLTADGGGAGLSLNEGALLVPLVVKQPEGAGAGRRVAVPVQHIDLVPTVLDLVRAPIPSGLRGRSLRRALVGSESDIPEQLIYAETLAGLFRFGGAGEFSLASSTHRIVRRGQEEVIDGEQGAAGAPPLASEALQLRSDLDRLLEGQALPSPAHIPAAEEDRLAALGYLAGVPLSADGSEPLEPDEEAWVVETHRAAAELVGQKRYLAAIGRLRAIIRAHPRMAVVQYQLGILLGRVGRVEEARSAFRAAASMDPDSPHVPIAVARLLLHAQQPEEAREQAARAVALAEHGDSGSRAAAHETAARVAIALDDVEGAEFHAEAAEQEDSGLPVRHFVSAWVLSGQGRHEEALSALAEAEAALEQDGRSFEGLQLGMGEALARLHRYAEAEERFRAELRAFPRSLGAYASLAMLYRESNRPEGAADVLEALVDAVPTPEGYETAGRLWTILGNPQKAAALRADARTLFPADRSLALFEQDARR